MKTLILASALTLITSGAFALDEYLGGSSEYYQSPLVDHSRGEKTNALGPHHDHGDNTLRNYIPHGHDVPVLEHPKASGDVNPNNMMHDHGDDTIKNFTPHPHS